MIPDNGNVNRNDNYQMNNNLNFNVQSSNMDQNMQQSNNINYNIQFNNNSLNQMDNSNLSDNSNKKNNNKIILFIVIAFLVILALGIVAFVLFGNKETNNNEVNDINTGEIISDSYREILDSDKIYFHIGKDTGDKNRYVYNNEDDNVRVILYKNSVGFDVFDDFKYYEIRLSEYENLDLMLQKNGLDNYEFDDICENKEDGIFCNLPVAANNSKRFYYFVKIGNNYLGFAVNTFLKDDSQNDDEIINQKGFEIINKVLKNVELTDVKDKTFNNLSRVAYFEKYRIRDLEMVSFCTYDYIYFHYYEGEIGYDAYLYFDGSEVVNSTGEMYYVFDETYFEYEKYNIDGMDIYYSSRSNYNYMYFYVNGEKVYFTLSNDIEMNLSLNEVYDLFNKLFVAVE